MKSNTKNTFQALHLCRTSSNIFYPYKPTDWKLAAHSTDNFPSRKSSQLVKKLPVSKKLSARKNAAGTGNKAASRKNAAGQGKAVTKQRSCRPVKSCQLAKKLQIGEKILVSKKAAGSLEQLPGRVQVPVSDLPVHHCHVHGLISRTIFACS
jgi:hypothetical protein